MKLLLPALSLLAFGAGPTRAVSSWYVDDDAAPNGNGSQTSPFQAIGQAFGVARPGDVIHIADGLYTGALNRNLCFEGDLQVLGSGSASCIIDCEQAGRAFDLESVGGTSLLRGITIRNGDASVGGKDPFNDGGGARLAGDTVMDDVHFLDCRGHVGGAFFQTEGVLDLAGVVVERCVAVTAGGAAWGAGRMRDCVFKDNQAAGSFSGALHLRGDTELLRCRFEGNSAATLAGAVCLSFGSLSVSHCEFLFNRSRHGGAVQSKTQSAVRISNTLFCGNEAFQGNGGAYIGAGALEMTQCTVVDNHASQAGGGVRYLISEGAVFSNCIFWGNTASAGDQLSLGAANPSVARVRFSNFEGGEAGVHIEPGSLLLWEDGNLAVDPRFRDARAGDYRLDWTSPCIHRGSNSEVPMDFLDVDGDGDTVEPMPLDLAGLARIARLMVGFRAASPTPAVVDLGAYEAQ